MKIYQKVEKDVLGVMNYDLENQQSMLKRAVLIILQQLYQLVRLKMQIN